MARRFRFRVSRLTVKKGRLGAPSTEGVDSALPTRAAAGQGPFGAPRTCDGMLEVRDIYYP
jgi:hypothetical protein